MELVGVGEIAEVFAVEDVRFVGHGHASAWEHAVVDGLQEQVVQFGPVWR